MDSREDHKMMELMSIVVMKFTIVVAAVITAIAIAAIIRK